MLAAMWLGMSGSRLGMFWMLHAVDAVWQWLVFWVWLFFQFSNFSILQFLQLVVGAAPWWGGGRVRGVCAGGGGFVFEQHPPVGSGQA